MIVLGIESTCDETAAAIVRDGTEILSNVVSSQIDLHNTFGGVVPELACRRHIDVIIPVIDKALQEANLTLADIDLIAVANGPGLIGAVMIGLNAAKGLSLALNIPFIGINHVEAHLYAAIMSHQSPSNESDLFPALGVVVSGGHTATVEMHSVGHYTLVGQTADDAAGEAFDKVAKMLGLPYPGGPEIESLAKLGDASRFSFKAGQVKGRPDDFSFSGLKTALLYAIKKIPNLTYQDKCDLSAGFQESALGCIVDKTFKAAERLQSRAIVFGGGVTNNKRLRQLVEERSSEGRERSIPVIWPSVGLSLDNAAMIAGLGYHHYMARGQGDSMDLDALSRISFL